MLFSANYERLIEAQSELLYETLYSDSEEDKSTEEDERYKGQYLYEMQEYDKEENIDGSV